MKLQNISNYKTYQTTKHIKIQNISATNISNYKTYQTTKHIRLQNQSTTNISNYKTYKQLTKHINSNFALEMLCF